MFIRVDYFIKIVESMIGQLKEMLRLPFFPHPSKEKEIEKKNYTSQR